MANTYSFALWLSLAVFALSCAALLVVRKEKQKRCLLSAIQLLQAGRILLLHMQRHRGLQTALLTGEQTTTEEVLVLKDRIIMDFQRMATLGDWLEENEDWRGLTRHWASLSVACNSLSITSNFDQHSRLISGLLQLLATIANYYGLEENARYSGVKVAWKEFLAIGENIGQCRALGVRVLAIRSETQESSRLRAQVAKTLVSLSADLNSTVCWRKLDQRKKESLEIFTEYVRTHIVEQRGMVSVMEYFDIASDAIELVYEQFDIEMMRLHRRIA